MRAITLLAMVAMLTLGLVVGQELGRASAQEPPPPAATPLPTPDPSEKAAAIKAGIRERIERYNAANETVSSFTLKPDVFSPFADTQFNAYWSGIASWSTVEGDPIVQHYLRYVYYHAHLVGRIGDEPLQLGQYPLQDRFLEGFALRLVASGIPPVAPTLSDAERQTVDLRIRNNTLKSNRPAETFLGIN